MLEELMQGLSQSPAAWLGLGVIIGLMMKYLRKH